MCLSRLLLLFSSFLFIELSIKLGSYELLREEVGKFSASADILVIVFLSSSGVIGLLSRKLDTFCGSKVSRDMACDRSYGDIGLAFSESKSNFFAALSLGL